MGQEYLALPQEVRRAVREDVRSAVAGTSGKVEVEVEVRVASAQEVIRDDPTIRGVPAIQCLARRPRVIQAKGQQMVQRIETVVIGGGQAGLSISYFLTQQGRAHVVLEQGTQVARAWRDARWDSFTLVIPNWSVRLAGFPYSGNNPDGFMTRSEIVSHLEQYTASFGAPLSYGVRVTAVDPTPDGNGFQVSTADGADYVAANVVVATGSFQFPKPTPLSAALPPHIFQLHSSQYRNPQVSATRCGVGGRQRRYRLSDR